MELDYKNIGKRIVRRRKSLKISQIDLAEKIGISNNYLSSIEHASIEHGKEKPSLDILVKICNAISVTPDYLIMGNMYSNNVPQNIADSLQLCSSRDVDLVNTLVQRMVELQVEKWNNDNFA